MIAEYISRGKYNTALERKSERLDSMWGVRAESPILAIDIANTSLECSYMECCREHSHDTMSSVCRDGGSLCELPMVDICTILECMGLVTIEDRCYELTIPISDSEYEAAIITLEYLIACIC
jgi:hypothetical protein